MVFKKIKTKRLSLAPLQSEDYEAMARFLNNKKIYDSTFHIPFPYTQEDAKKYIANSQSKFEKIGTRDYGIYFCHELVGCISISVDALNKSGEIAYWIAEMHWNKGYASEALAAILETAFLVDGYNKVYGYHYSGNVASKRVMMNNAMKNDGVLREHIFKDEQYRDICICSILRNEYKKGLNTSHNHRK